MAAIAPIEDLTAAKVATDKVKFTKAQKDVLKTWGPKVGWKNIMHMLVYGRTPQELKEGKRK